ncbi:hypothetical protein GGR54DRAFT_462524 [Hypoxylon sp. NC1633]|nr:hypothetical protein GGR54DRAFT_462524 [Hypoxylon sp. NC1633]
MLRTNQLLLQARKRISKTTYKIVNKKTGCYGVAVKDSPSRRSHLTIHHGVRCGCAGVHMIHLHKHANVVYKRNWIKRGRRDDLIMAIKLRLPDMGFKANKRKRRKPVKSEEAGERPLRVVEGMPSGQMLIEEWDSVEAWKNRKIWRDW